MSTATTWNSGGSTDANLAGNYSAGLPADAVVTLDATSVVNWIFTANMSVESITITAAYTGVVTMTGFTLTCSLGFSDDGITGVHTYGTSITCNGNNSTLHVGSGIASVTATSTAIIMNGTTAMILDIDKASVWYSLTLGALAKVTISGAAGTFVLSSAANPILSVGNNATLTVNQFTQFSPTITSTVFSWGIGVTFNGNGGWTIRPGGNNITLSISETTYSGTGGVYFNDWGSSTLDGIWSFTGNQNYGGNTFYVHCDTAGALCTLTTNNNSLTCGQLNLGANNATATFNFNAGASIISITSYTGVTYNTGTININYQTSQISCSGSWAFGSNHIVNPGTSIVTITNTSTITSTGKSFYDLIINAATKTITCADALTCAAGGDLTLTAGTLTLATFNLTVGGNTAVNGTSTLNATGSTCSFAGNYTTAAGSTITINAATNYTFTAATVVTTNGKTLPQVTFNSNFSINDTCTITRLIRGVDGFTGTFEAGNTFTISNLAAANWNGAAGSLNAVRSSVPGTQFTIVLPNAATLTYYDSQDCIYQGFDITANDGTSLTQGNNVRYLTFNVVTIVPATGPAGTPFVLNDTGNGFGGVMVVTFGGVAAAGATVDEDQYSGVVPGGAAGVVNVVITNGDGDTRTLVGAFTVLPGIGGGVEGGSSRCYIADGSIGI